MVRDVAYQQIPRARRAEKHVAAAGWIAGTAQERVGDHADILVHHYEQALVLGGAGGDPAELREALAQALVMAGERAMQLDIAAAETAFRRALELLEDSPVRASVLIKLADALQEEGRLPEAAEKYEEGLSALPPTGDERLKALGLLGLGRTMWRVGETARSRDLVLDALPLLEREPGAELVLGYERIASVDVLGGRSQEGLEWAEKGIALARELGIENVVRHLQFRGLARIDLGDLKGIGDLREALELSLKLGLGFETATSYNNLGEIVATYEDMRTGLELTEASLEFARRRGMTHHEMWTRAARLWWLYDLGEWDELVHESDELVHWDRGQGGTQIEVSALMVAAPARAQRGDLERALGDVAVFLPRARQIADPQMLAPALTHAAFVDAFAGRLEEAVDLTREFEVLSRNRRWRAAELSGAIRVCVAAGELALGETLVAGTPPVTESPPRSSSVTTARAVLAEARGQTDTAAALYRAAADGWERWGSVVERAYALLGVARTAGDQDALADASAIFERLRAVPFTELAA